MKLIIDLLSWSFIAVSFIIYVITQFFLGMVFISEENQVSSGARYRLRKLLELGIPTILGMIAGYLIEIPAPDVIQVDPIARSIYFGFAGGASPMVHTGVEAMFPEIAAKVGAYLKGLIPSNASKQEAVPETEKDKKG